MKKLSQRDKAFIELWESGHRFLDEEDMKSRDYGVYREHFGKIEGYTIEGMKNLAKSEKFKLYGEELDEEQIEALFSYMKYISQFK